MATGTSRKPKVTKEAITAAPLSVTELQDRIAARAYEIYLSRNGTAGDELSNWLLAEHEICTALSNSIADEVVPTISATPKPKRTSTTQSTITSSSTRKPKTSSATRSQKGKQASE